MDQQFNLVSNPSTMTGFFGTGASVQGKNAEEVTQLLDKYLEIESSRRKTCVVSCMSAIVYFTATTGVLVWASKKVINNLLKNKKKTED